MSQRCVGYAGDGKARRPIWSDEGPASASIAGRFGEGKTALLDGLPDRVEGAGVVETRMATEAQRAAWAAAEVTERPRRPVPPVWPKQEEEPTVAGPAQESTGSSEPETRGNPFSILAMAAEKAAEAHDEYVMAEDRWVVARNELDVAMAEVDAIRPRPPDLSEHPVIVRIAEAYADVVREGMASVALDGETQVVEPAVKTGADHSDPIPEAAPKRRRRGGKVERAQTAEERARLVQDALERHGGDTKAAGLELGMRGNVVARIAQAARVRQAAGA